MSLGGFITPRSVSPFHILPAFCRVTESTIGSLPTHLPSPLFYSKLRNVELKEEIEDAFSSINLSLIRLHIISFINCPHKRCISSLSANLCISIGRPSSDEPAFDLFEVLRRSERVLRPVFLLRKLLVLVLALALAS